MSSAHPIRVKNDGTDEIPAFGIMLVTGVFRQNNNGVALKVRSIQVPNATAGRAMLLVNSANPIGTGGASRYGWGRNADGVGWVAYDTANTPAFGEMWGVSHESFTLGKNDPGFEIVGLEDSGNKRVMARLNLEPKCYFQLTAALPAASDMLTGAATATAAVLKHSSGSLTTGQAITVTNRWEDLELDIGKRGYALWDWSLLEWVIVATECP